MNAYRQRILATISRLLAPQAPLSTGLDFGAGDGWFAMMLRRLDLVAALTAVDVLPRARSWFPVQMFDGSRLPFRDRSFDLTYCIDTLHHCAHPRASLEEVLRCTKSTFLLKDHTCRDFPGRIALGVLDELGNRRFGVPSRYAYQRGWEWFSWVESCGFVLQTLIHPAPCHRGWWGRLTNGLQFIALWRRHPE
jgi:SAM-dependent methyltransferase